MIPVTQAHNRPLVGGAFLVAAAAESCPKCGLPLPQAVPAALSGSSYQTHAQHSLPEIDAAPAPGETDPLADADPNASSSVAADPTVLQQMPADSAPRCHQRVCPIVADQLLVLSLQSLSLQKRISLRQKESPYTRYSALSTLVTTLVVAAIYHYAPVGPTSNR